MPYQLRTDHSVGKELHRVVEKELREAIDRLSHAQLSAKAIHTARKSIKKVRAVLTLVGRELEARHATSSLRRVGRLLSPLRDTDALIGTVRTLCSSQRSMPAQNCVGVQQRLQREKARLAAEVKRDRVNKQAAKTLAHVQRSTKHWHWKAVGFSALTSEVRRSYKRARRAMREAQADGGPEAFHTWRKRVKTHWYALRLLQQRVRPLGETIATLDTLQDRLGDDHNLAVLADLLANGPQVAGTSRLMTLAENRQQRLRQQALTTGARVFRESPKAFARRIQRMSKDRRDARRAGPEIRTRPATRSQSQGEAKPRTRSRHLAGAA